MAASAVQDALIRFRSLITVAAYQGPPVALTIFRLFNSSAA